MLEGFTENPSGPFIECSVACKTKDPPNFFEALSSVTRNVVVGLKRFGYTWMPDVTLPRPLIYKTGTAESLLFSSW